MPYFKSADGRVKGRVSDGAIMVRLEEAGYVRLEGRELFVRIVWKAVKEWGIPSVCALIAFHFSDEFLLGLIVFCVVQGILD